MMQATILHLQDDLDAAQILWLAKNDITKHKIFITPKYGKFRTKDVKDYFKVSDAVILFVFDPSIPLDDKTRKEIELAIKEQKDIFLIAPQKWKMPKMLKDYRKLNVVPLNNQTLIKVLQKRKKKSIDRVILPILLHAASKINSSEWA